MSLSKESAGDGKCFCNQSYLVVFKIIIVLSRSNT